MSLHIQASQGQIAETVLISGDPLRAKYVAEKMLKETICYNEVRGMLGFTGLYNGKRVSVQGTGMGIPSTAIYVHELIHDYGVKKIIRIGTCGGLQPDLPLGCIILGERAYTDSSTNQLYYGSMDHVNLASPALLQAASEYAASNRIRIRKGSIYSTDTFYGPYDESRWDKWIEQGLLGIEMESSILYTLADVNKIDALSILAVSDNLITKEYFTAKEREEVGLQLIRLALEIG